ncbi:sialoadhesin-like isoform X2 [Lepidochelys kempii]|uniref:sialoadhesin-like isoform X2 n=1 Tax=Lepidochelys kempii TaxID=8472 RepID=UPI003C6EE2CD
MPGLQQCRAAGPWGEEAVQSQLRASRRNYDTQGQISRCRRERGHGRDTLPCRVTGKELRNAHHRAREANHQSGAAPTSCRFYKELDAMLGGDPTSTAKAPVDTSLAHVPVESGLSQEEEISDEDGEEDPEAEDDSETREAGSQELFSTPEQPSRSQQSELGKAQTGEESSGRLSALPWTEMALVLVPAFCLLSGAYAQDWGVRLAPGPLAGGTDSCVTIPCSFTYPAGWTVSAVSWTREKDQTVYHWDEARVHADFKGRARYLGDLQRDCSLRVSGLRPSDQGTYRFCFHAARDGRTDTWGSEPGQRLNVSDDLCQPSLGRRTQPGPSLTCSVGATCPHPPSWYDRDGARRSPGQTSGGAGATELRISPSQLDPGAALRCQVDGYRDECDSDQTQPLGTVAPKVPRVEVSWLAGKAPLREGDSFTLHCQAAALRPITGYVWSHGDVWLPGAGQDLHVEKAAVSDGGSYACGVWVSGPGWGYLSLSARESVEVQHAPTGVHVTAALGTSPQAGESVTLTCSYTSSLPAPNSYTWYRGDRQLGGSRREMVLKSITAEQAGEYRCKADNGIGQSRSPPINITVLSTPRVWAPAYILGPAVALILLLLVGLVGVIAWRKRRSERQGLSSDPRAHQGVPGLSGWHRAIPHLQPAHEHGKNIAGAELSRRPETESPYEELQGPTQDIYSELVYPQAGSH